MYYNRVCTCSDTAIVSVYQLSEATSKYESSCQQVESLQQSLADESRQRKLIEQRFSILAKNHEEMIRFKDEYKGRAQALERELVSGQRERAVGQERTLQLQEEVGKVERVWQEKMGNAERRCTLVAEQRDLAEKRLGQLETNLQVSTREREGVLQHMQSSLTGITTTSCQCGLYSTLYIYRDGLGQFNRYYDYMQSCCVGEHSLL